MRQIAAAVALLCLTACGSDGPTAPPAAAQTRIIAIQGDLNFGDVSVGSTADRTIRIANQGNAPMTVTGLSGPGGFAASWTNGTIAPNAGQDVLFRFSPTEPRSYSGTLTVNANHTSGINTLSINARGTREPFRRSGIGNTVFDLPAGITRVRIIGVYNGSSSNFIIRIDGRTVVNELLGTFWGLTRYDGQHLISGTVVEVRDSTGVDWSIEEIQQ